MTIHTLLQQKTDSIAYIESRIGYSFQDKTLLLRAITHKSALIRDTQDRPFNYEKLEHLGDRVIELLDAQNFFFHNNSCEPHHGGDVSNAYLVKMALALHITQHIISNSSKAKIFSDTMEAIFASIYLDCKKNINIVQRIWDRAVDLTSLNQQVSSYKYQRVLFMFYLDYTQVYERTSITKINENSFIASFSLNTKGAPHKIYNSEKESEDLARTEIFHLIIRDLRFLLLQQEEEALFKRFN